MSKSLNCYGEVLWLFLSKPCHCSPHHRVWSGKLPRQNHRWANTSVSQQHPSQHKNHRGGDFALQKMIAGKQIMFLLRSAQCLEVSAKSTDTGMRQETTGICNRQERAWTGSPAAGPMYTTGSVDSNGFLSTTCVLSEHHLPKNPKLRDSAVAIADYKYSLHLPLCCRTALQFWTVINRENSMAK